MSNMVSASNDDKVRIVYLNEEGAAGAIYVHPVGDTLIGHTWVWNPDAQRIETYCSCEGILYVTPEASIRKDKLY